MAEISVSVNLVGPLRAAVGEPAATASATPILAGPVLVSGDLVRGGRGAISGTVKVKSTPTNVPLRRKVRLHREVDGLAVRETWSHPATGAYYFSDIDPAYTYYIVSFDYEQNYRAVIADNLTPEVA